MPPELHQAGTEAGREGGRERWKELIKRYEVGLYLEVQDLSFEVQEEGRVRIQTLCLQEQSLSFANS